MKPKNNFKVAGRLVYLELTQGQVTCIDWLDWERVSQHRWCAEKRKNGFYATTRHKNKLVYLHRFILGAARVDHKSGDTLDNTHQNLRPSSHAQNMRNAQRRKDNTSGFKGVGKAGQGKWRARIRLDGVEHHLGCFSSPSVAAAAYDEAAKKLHGVFARLNFQ